MQIGVITGETGPPAEEMRLSFKAEPATPWNCQLHTSSVPALAQEHRRIGTGSSSHEGGSRGKRSEDIRGTKRGHLGRCVIFINHLCLEFCEYIWFYSTVLTIIQFKSRLNAGHWRSGVRLTVCGKRIGDKEKADNCSTDVANMSAVNRCQKTCCS